MILDASVTLAFCLPDQRTPYILSVVESVGPGRCRVPAIWGLEVANVLAMCRRRGSITEHQFTSALDWLRLLPVDIDPADRQTQLGNTLRLAREHGLTAYDASYLELAQRLGMPLATLDQDLVRAAGAAGVELFAA